MKQKRALEAAKETASFLGLNKEFSSLDPDLMRNYVLTDNDIWVVLNALLMLKMNYNNSIQMAYFVGDNHLLNELLDRIEEIWEVYEKIKNRTMGMDWSINVAD